MTIVVAGGGSGGHITPILAVAAELKKLRPDARIVYIGQTGESLLDVPAADPNIDEVLTVRAGKFRRYHGAGLKQLLDLRTQAKNVRDAIYVLIGAFQSVRLLGRLGPSVIFTRGGFVSVPVACGAILRHIPYVTHDSDSVPSLANRIIAGRAALHTVALPKELYPYPASNTVTVGIPLNTNNVLVTPELRAAYRQQLGLTAYKQVLLVTGGGNGAQRLNRAVVASVGTLLESFPELTVIHLAGRSHEEATEAEYLTLPPSSRGRVQVLGFVADFYKYSGAADVIVARGGATNLAEFAVQGKACIIVPAGQLVGDHQTKNAQVLAEHGAIVLLTEEQSEQDGRLAQAVADLLTDTHRREALALKLQQFGHRDAARRLAMLLLDQVKK